MRLCDELEFAYGQALDRRIGAIFRLDGVELAVEGESAFGREAEIQPLGGGFEGALDGARKLFRVRLTLHRNVYAAVVLVQIPELYGKLRDFFRGFVRAHADEVFPVEKHLRVLVVRKDGEDCIVFVQHQRDGRIDVDPHVGNRFSLVLAAVSAGCGQGYDHRARKACR